MQQILHGLPRYQDDRLLVGVETSDDAGVFDFDGENCLVQSTDIITPVVDDPFIFGEIATNNALSDIFAMGGTPLTAMTLMISSDQMPNELIREVLAGAFHRLKEEKCTLVGGHTMDDSTLKLGVAATGIVKKDKIYKNCTAQEGDVIILTKPLGLGTITTAFKQDKIAEGIIDEAIHYMRQSNRIAMTAAQKVCDIHACTDITGFGLTGHLYEMAAGSQKQIEIDFASVPMIKGSRELAQQNVFPGGARRNRTYSSQYTDMSQLAESIHEQERLLVFDPQTAGGLAIAVNEQQAPAALQSIREAGVVDAEIIATVKAGEAKIVYR